MPNREVFMKRALPAIASLLLLSGCTTAHVFSETLHARMHDDPAMLVKNGVPAETGRWGLWAMTHRSSTDCAKLTKRVLALAMTRDLDSDARPSQKDMDAINTLKQNDVCSQQTLKPSTTDPATAK